ncbi:MAG: glycosyltransferase family 4 protein [Eubacterium sp.]|nr:glycosyltransferase family 4 protein [Eubacterium sp.]
MKKRVLMLASVASMIDQFNMPNIRLMQDEGYQVHVACNFEEGNTCDVRRIQQLKDMLHQLGVRQHQWDCPRNLYPPWRWLRAYRQLWNLTKRYHFAWIHCHSPVGGVLARAAAHQRGIAVIYTAHGFHFYKGAPFRNWLLYYPVEKLLSGWTDVLVTINQEDYQLAGRSMKAGKVYYIPGIGIDTVKFQRLLGAENEAQAVQDGERSEIRIRYGIPEDALLLLSVGELSRRKNHQAAIKALAGIGRTDIYYLICGQGALHKELWQLAGRLDVADRVIMPGFQQNMAGLYRSADIFVFPSLQEGMPAALMEAMAAGLPCVVSDIRGSRELIDQWGGIKFLVTDIGRLKDAILYFADHPEERGLCGRHNQEIITGYSMETVQNQMRMIYEDMKKYQ